MSEINHQLFIKSNAPKIFQEIATCKGIDHWWTLKSSGDFDFEKTITFDFGSEIIWKGTISKFKENEFIEFTMFDCAEDWVETRVGFIISETKNGCNLTFYHHDWKVSADHYAGTSYCWAIYLRLIKLYLEKGETVAYEHRLDV